MQCLKNTRVQNMVAGEQRTDWNDRLHFDYARSPGGGCAGGVGSRLSRFTRQGGNFQTGAVSISMIDNISTSSPTWYCTTTGPSRGEGGSVSASDMMNTYTTTCYHRAAYVMRRRIFTQGRTSANAHVTRGVLMLHALFNSFYQCAQRSRARLQASKLALTNARANIIYAYIWRGARSLDMNKI